MTSSVAIVLFVIGLIASIMLHEWGHFFSARRFGMRADRFFLGFGPTLWSTRRGETEYGVKAIPAGGFVRIRGMTPQDVRRKPVVEALVDTERLAADRRAAAEESGRDVLEVPAVPEQTWQRLDHLLAERGAPRDLRQRIVGRTRRNAGEDATPQEVAATLLEVLTTETTDTGRLGDLHHRLMHGDQGRFFHDRPAWQRAIVLAAGSAMHFMIAFVLLFVGFLTLPQLTGDVTNEIRAFTEDSVAAEAGLQPGDRILGVGATRTDDFDEIREMIRARPGEPTDLTIERDGEELVVTVTPARQLDEASGEYIGLLGFYPAPEQERLEFGDALYEATIGPSSIPATIVGSAKGLGDVFGPQGLSALFQQVAGEVERDQGGGVSVVGVPVIAGEGTEMFGPMFLIGMLASVNVFIGVFNLLPLPPLDGGHLAVLAWERSVNAIRRRRGRPADYHVDPRAIAAIALPVIVLFGTVSLALIWLDITNPVTLN